MHKSRTAVLLAAAAAATAFTFTSSASAAPAPSSSEPETTATAFAEAAQGPENISTPDGAPAAFLGKAAKEAAKKVASSAAGSAAWEFAKAHTADHAQRIADNRKGQFLRGEVGPDVRSDVDLSKAFD
ncbi:hypothetical protein ACIPYS_21295 [Kitasatospora sp. NPDC089913]|uniref:hypothetical protein n=1 Tax=Kitasatospora sp. NPDC089913 TaxID=3364080 RepID=UPI003808996D